MTIATKSHDLKPELCNFNSCQQDAQELFWGASNRSFLAMFWMMLSLTKEDVIITQIDLERFQNRMTQRFLSLKMTTAAEEHTPTSNHTSVLRNLSSSMEKQTRLSSSLTLLPQD